MTLILEEIGLILVTVANIILGIFVLFRNRKSRINISYTIFVFSVSVWALTNYLFQITYNERFAFLMALISYEAALIISLSLLSFSYFFPTSDYTSKLDRFLVFRLAPLFFVLVFIFILFPNIVLISVDIKSEIRTLNTGPGLKLFGLTLFLFFFCTLKNLFVKYRKLIGLKKKQISVVFWSLLFSIFFGVIFNLVFPILGVYNFVSFGPDFALIMVLGFAYAITKYRLMDIRLVITRSILYFFLTLFVTGSFTLLIFFTGQIFGAVTGTNSLLVTILVSVFIVLLIDPLKKGIARMTEVIFFKSRIDYPKVLHGLTTIASVELNLQDLITKMTKTLTNEIKLHGATILLLTERKSFSPIHAPTINHITNTLMEKDPFLPYLRRANETIVLEELDRAVADAKTPRDRKKMEAVLATMELFKAEAAVPVISKNRLIAIIVLDRKLSGDVFNQDDINLLDVLAPQIASSIEKAQLYEKSLQFGERLKVEVKKATNDLRVANNKLKELDQSKSEFMSIASHQLRTPLTGLMGYLSMLSEGDYGNLSKKQIMIVHELLEAAQRLIRMVNLFLNVTRIEAGRFLLNLTPIDMGQLVGNAVQELRPTATKRKLTLIYNQPKTSLPAIQGDSDKIKDVALNLIDNAIKYSQQGSVTIDLGMDQKTNSIRVSVRDTGIGIEPHEAKKLFDKFVRGKHIARVSPDGSGLGLFIAKKIIDSHQGKIWVESEGEGKGSTFFFELPIKTKTPATM